MDYSAEKKIVEAAHIIIANGELLSWDPTTRAGEIFEEILHRAREWDWLGVEELLDKLYALVGAENEYTGYAFHIGRHPLQEYIASVD